MVSGDGGCDFSEYLPLQQEKPDHVLILSGDHIYKMDYRKMIAFHLEKGADLTVGCDPDGSGIYQGSLV